MYYKGHTQDDHRTQAANRWPPLLKNNCITGEKYYHCCAANIQLCSTTKELPNTTILLLKFTLVELTGAVQQTEIAKMAANIKWSNARQSLIFADNSAFQWFFRNFSCFGLSLSLLNLCCLELLFCFLFPILWNFVCLKEKSFLNRFCCFIVLVLLSLNH